MGPDLHDAGWLLGQAFPWGHSQETTGGSHKEGFGSPIWTLVSPVWLPQCHPMSASLAGHLVSPVPHLPVVCGLCTGWKANYRPGTASSPQSAQKARSLWSMSSLPSGPQEPPWAVGCGREFIVSASPTQEMVGIPCSGPESSPEHACHLYLIIKVYIGLQNLNACLCVFLFINSSIHYFLHSLIPQFINSSIHYFIHSFIIHSFLG